MFCALFALLSAVGTVPSTADTPVRVAGQVVSDEDGKPMPGALVAAERNGSEAYCDTEGRYAIEADACDTLAFRYVTFEEQRIPVAGRLTIDVRMREDTTSPDSVVVRTWIKPRKR